MSAETNETSTHRPTTGDDRVDALESKLDVALDRIDELEETVEKQDQEITDLREELDSRAAVRWADPNPREITVENSETEQFIEIGRKVYENTDTIDELDDRVTKLQVDGVDTEDVIGLTGDDEPALPIEDTIAALRSDVRENPSANKARATVVFRAFGGRASATKGGNLVLKSSATRSILEDPDKGNMDDVNRNTLKRTMHQCAKLTSPEENPRDRDARSNQNLITLEERNGRLALVADRDDWHEYLQEVESRYE